MNCERFEQQLDAEGPAGLTAAAQAHADACPRCARALAAARSVEAMLDVPVVTRAPSGFTDRVLARIRTEAHPKAAPAAPRAFSGFDPMPTWIRFIAEPATAGALVIAALIVWQAPQLLTLARAWTSALASAAAQDAAAGPTQWATALQAAFHDPVRLALVMAGGSLAPLVALYLFRWTERLTTGGARRR
jgi:hypothetical protein